MLYWEAVARNPRLRSFDPGPARIDDAIAITWWPDGFGVIGSADTSPSPLLTSGNLELGDLQLSGLAKSDDRLWLSAIDGQLFEIGPANDIVNAEVRGAFETGVPINDLARVVSRGPCPAL